MSYYNFKEITNITRLATQFCELDLLRKFWLGEELNIISHDDYNLTIDQIEIKIWDTCLKTDKMRELSYYVDFYMGKSI